MAGESWIMFRRIAAGSIGSLVATTLFLSVSCMHNEEYGAKNDSRNLQNGTSTFVYNMIPPNADASISPEYSAAINSFSVNLMKRIYSGEQVGKNLVVSPFSISRNLAALSQGCVGESKRQLLFALGGPKALDDAKDALCQLLYADKSIIFQCADAFWIDAQFSLKPSFRHTINTKFGVEITSMDFTDVAGSVNTANSWVGANTNGYIKKVLEEKDISPQTMAICANALYFEADWTSPFDVTKTAEKPFWNSAGETKVKMMKSTHLFSTRHTARYENAKLYYGTDKKNFFYLDLYMPAGGTVGEFLNNGCLEALGCPDSSKFNGIELPKFFFTTKMDLAPVLKDLGITGIFDPSKGEMCEMVDGAADNLYVEKVHHQAGIKTDEEGTKAFAVTASVMGTGSGGPQGDVVFDHPFVYFIRAGLNGLVLFSGVVDNPQ